MAGYKTYLSAFGIALVGTLHATGMLGDGGYQFLISLLGASSIAALRSAVDKKD